MQIIEYRTNWLGFAAIGLILLGCAAISITLAIVLPNAISGSSYTTTTRTTTTGFNGTG